MCPFAIALRILAIAFIATASLHLMFGLYADANPTNPGFISIVTVLEIVWVLRSLLKQTPLEIAKHLEHLLAADSLHIQNEQQVFEATFALKRGIGEFEDALIGALNHWAGCPHTLTFDKRALRMSYFQLIT